MFTMPCPICHLTIYKDRWEDPWVCNYCGFRSDDRDEPVPSAHLTHLTDSYSIV